MDPLELEFNNADAQQTLYEDVLIRKKSLQSLNSIVQKEDRFDDFGGINNNNSFIIENPEPEEKHDKEMLPDVEMFDD